MQIFSPPEHFDTPTFLARPLHEADAPSVFANLLSNPQVTWHLPAATHLSLEQTKFYLRCWEAAWRCSLYYVWGLEEKRTGQILGSIEMRPTLPRVEVGIVTARQEGAKRSRAASEAFLTMLDWLAAQPQVYRIHACCDPDSVGAHFIRHFGFYLETRLAGWEERPNQNKPAGDINMYTLMRPFAGLNNGFCTRLRKRIHAYFSAIEKVAA